MPIIHQNFTPISLQSKSECLPGVLYNRILKVRNIIEPKPIGLMLIMGKENISKDTMSILGQQLPRVINSKTPYPVAFLHDKAKVNFEKSIEVYKDAHTEENMHGEHDKSLSNNRKVGHAFCRLANNQENVLLDNVNLNSVGKLYILGHGSAGIGVIKSGEQIFNIKEIVDILESKGILDAVKDLRFTSCYSADVSPPKSMSPEDIDAANSGSGIILGGKMSFIDLVSNEIWERGYTDVKISGYHGAGVFYKGKDLPLTHLRSSSIQASDTVKREHVRVTLRSEVD